eukprot:TRINITY_DN10506_c0_g1_i1.p1 TRINITY_DN10506_c0_g1~~TRINITY_DN10506_c0_g1_i1.p1  ORF type:complete len:266 (+),score=84.99 TRINITY_DN10506_c0_g1_i1:113-910(+)
MCIRDRVSTQSTGEHDQGRIGDTRAAEIAMSQFMMKLWCQNKLDNCKLSDEEARDPTKMKASTFARWLGLGGSLIMLFAGAFALAKKPGYCKPAGFFSMLGCVPILILEIGFFILKPKTELTPEELAGPKPKDPNEPEAPEHSEPETDDAEDGEQKKGCCSNCIGKVIRCCLCRKLYENWYLRGLLYIVLAIFTFPCGVTLVAGVLLLICAFLYIFARWRGEIPPVIEEEVDPAAAENEEVEEEVEEKPKKEKKRKKKPAKHTQV